MITIINSKNQVISTMSAYTPIIVWAVALMVGIAIYVLMGFGLRKMAINSDLKHKNYAFIPVLRWILVGEIAGKVRIFRKSTNSVGLILAIVSLVFFLLTFLIDIINNVPVIYYALSGQNVDIRFQIVETMYNYDMGYYIACIGSTSVYDLMFSQSFLRVVNFIQTITNVISLFYIFFLGIMSSAVFRKYVPQRALLFSIFSLIPVLLLLTKTIYGFTIASFIVLINIFGIIVFCLRNRSVIDYKQYLARRYGFYGQKRYGADSNPYSNRNYEKEEGDPFNQSENHKRTDDSDPFDDYK